MARGDLPSGDGLVRLSLSSSAAPDEGLAGLLEACRRKALSGLELVQGDGHGLDARDPTWLPDMAMILEQSGVGLTGYRLRSTDDLHTPVPLRIAGGLGSPVLVPLALDGAGGLEEVERAAGAFAKAGSRLVGASDDAAALLVAARSGAPLDLAWDVRPGVSDPADLDRLLAGAGERLTHIRLFGGGPETSAQNGTGVGTLMSRLAVTRWGGSVVITPSDPRYRVAWSTWLGRRNGWGCSGKATPAEPLALHRAGGAS